jgi:hypothetical protein
VLAYIGSPECVTFLEHTLAFKLSGRIVDPGGPLFYELSNGASIYGINADQARALFAILVDVVALVIKISGVTREESLSVNEAAKASAIVSESALLAIEGHVRTLSQADTVSIELRREILEEYKKSASGVLGRIQPPNFDGAKNVPLESLFVVPRLRLEDRKDHDITVDELLHASRVVVLGDPGGGKTTLAKKIASSLASGSLKVRQGSVDVIPFMVILREYGPELANNSLSIAEFIAKTARATFQVDISVDVIHWVLATSQAYIVFDGLDELLKTDSRQRISDAITAFSIRYPNVQILVTSRRVGYSQAPLPVETFSVVGLSDLDESQVKKYVRNWFQLDDSLTDVERERVETSFLAESETVNDLRKNPLMLALMCTIYRAEGYIPRNRPDMYEKCSRMLFDRWDRHRGLLEPFEFEAHVEPALMSIAYSIFCNEEHQAGVPENYLINLASDYLHRWQYADKVKALNAACTFIDFCRGRAWIFSDVGLDENEQSLFQFTHRTFLEYFAAAHLARVNSSLDSLCDLLLPRIEKSEWDVVAQLALQIKSKPLQGGADIVMRRLAARIEARRDVTQLSNLVPFMSRCLRFMIVSPATIDAIATTLVKSTKVLAENGRGGAARGVCWDVHASATETREALINSVAEQYMRSLESMRSESGYVAGLVWCFATHGDERSLEFERLSQLNSTLELALEKHPGWGWASANRFYGGQMSAAMVVADLGSRVLDDCEIPGIGISLYPPPATSLAHVLYMGCKDKRRCDDHFQMVAAVAPILAQPEDCVRDRKPVSFIDLDTFSPPEACRQRHRRLTSEEIVAAALLFAWYSEMMSNKDVLLKMVARSRLRPVMGIFKGRFLGRATRLSSLEFDDVVGWDTLIKWSRKEVTFFPQ